MKTTIIKVDRTELLTKLKLAGKIINTNSKITPATAWFLIKTDAGNLKVTGSDGEGAITVIIECVEVSADAEFCIEAKKILDILPEIPEQVLTLEINDTKMKADYFPGTFEVPTYNATEFVELKESDEAKVLHFDTEKLSRGLGQVVGCVGDNELHPQLMGVLIDVEYEKFTIVATDAHMLSMREYKCSFDEAISILIPEKAVKMIQSLVPVFDEEVEMKVSKNNVSITSNGHKFIYQMINAKFPNYRSIIPVNNDIQIKITRSDLLGALRRTSVFSNASSMVVFDIHSDSLTLKSEDSDFQQSSSEEIAINYQGPDIRIGFSAKKMITLLSSISHDHCTLQLTTPSRPALIIPDDIAEGITLLLMPFIINKTV